MRIGLIVDEKSEVVALPPLCAQLREATGNTIVGPVIASLHPNARVAAIASVAIERVEYLLAHKVDQAIVRIDRELRPECPGQLAAQLHQQIEPNVTIPVSVVIKDRMFENWFVADVEALRAMQARFDVSDATIRSIAPDRADSINAYEVLSRCALRRSYHKVEDSRQILGHADILRMAENSRSFRRFLRCVGHLAYATQSKYPIVIDD